MSYFLYNSYTWTLHLKIWAHSPLYMSSAVCVFGGYIWSQCALHLKILPSCSLHLNLGVYLHLNTSSENMNSFQVWVSLCTSSEKLTELFTSSEPGGISESEHFIWKYELILGLHLSVHFIWKVDLVVHFIWKLDLIVMTVSNGLSLKT